MNGVACAVEAVNDTRVVCVTGQRPVVEADARLAVTVVAKGTAVVPTHVAYLYIDRWSARTTWLNGEFPGDGWDVVVPRGQALLVDQDTPLIRILTVQGLLIFDNKDIMLNASYIYVYGGTFQVGTVDEPFQHKAYITLHGDRRKTIELPFVGAKVRPAGRSPPPQRGSIRFRLDLPARAPHGAYVW